MAFKIIASKKFRNKLASVRNYLERKWSPKVAGDFLDEVESALLKLSKVPTSGANCAKKTDVRRRTISKYNRIYYRIRGEKVQIIELIDTRKDPLKNKYE